MTALLCVLLCTGWSGGLAGAGEHEADDPKERTGCPEHALIEGYRLNHVLLYSKDRRVVGNDPTELREPQEAIFQISIRKRLLECFPFYFGYTQRSFWQVYDEAASRPFRETNYNPELLVTTPNHSLWDGAEVGFQIGIEHESNGRGIEEINGSLEKRSRSWNRVYVWPRFVVGKSRWLTLAPKWWHRLSEKQSDDPLDPSGDDNPDIEEYLGHAELNILVEFPGDRQLNLLYRKGNLDPQGTLRVDFLFHPNWSWLSENVWVHAQYFYGYGESLIDYNRKVNRLGWGIAYGNPNRVYTHPTEPAIETVPHGGAPPPQPPR